MKRFSVKAAVCLTGALLMVLGLPGIAAAQMSYENIYTDYGKFYSHFSPQGKHTDTENYKLMPAANRHAACADCHDPHSATRSPSPLGSYFGAGTQANVSGARPLYWGRNPDGTINYNDKIVTPGAAPNFTFISSVVKEYELCFKCHSSYSYGSSPPKFNWTQGRYWQPGDPSGNDIIQETDSAKEFNPNNASYLPVVARGKTSGSLVPSWAGGATYNETFTAGWSATSFVKCSDCHRSDVGTIDPVTKVKTYTIKGTHGSQYKFILGRPSPSVDPIQTSWGSHGAHGWTIRTADNICYDCHDYKYFGPGNRHPDISQHQGQTYLAGHIAIRLDLIGCSTCKVMPPHGSGTDAYMMKNPGGSWCNNCHYSGGLVSARTFCASPSCPRFYSYDEKGAEQEEVRVHFQSARMKDPNEFFVPLPSPDIPILKGLGVKDEYRYETREDDYILFKEGKPKEEDGQYKVRYDQPSIGEQPDGEPTDEVGYEDQIALWTIDHAPGTQAYLSIDGDVCVVKDSLKPKTAVDNKGNNVLSMISERTPKEEEKDGWFVGTVGYGNTIDEIYSKGNYFILDFGNLSKAQTLKLLWRVNEFKGTKYPIYIQTQDENGQWVTRGSARGAEDRYGAMDISSFFPKDAKNYKIKVIPTLNFVDWMGVATSLQDYKVQKLSLSKAMYSKYSKDNSNAKVNITGTLSARDGNYQKFDYGDSCDLYFPVPAKNKTLTKRDFVFAPVGYFETGGPPSENYEIEPMTAEKTQGFATLTPVGDYANHYEVKLADPDEWNERHGVTVTR